VRRTQRSSTDGAGLDITGATNLLTVIAGYRISLTERFVAYRAVNGMCGTKPITTNETISEVFVADLAPTV
jgi:hypothetical protein